MNIEAARKHSKVVVLDLETTGVNPDEDEVLQVAITDLSGKTLWNKHYKPERVTEWPEAQEINGISPSDVAGCGYLSSDRELIQAILDDAEAICIYNKTFDAHFLMCAGIWVDPRKQFCTMVEFSELYGLVLGDGRMQKLIIAAKSTGYESPRGARAHDALEDCRMTAHVTRWCIDQWQRMRESPCPVEPDLRLGKNGALPNPRGTGKIHIKRKPGCVIAWSPTHFQDDFKKRKLGVTFNFTIAEASLENIPWNWSLVEDQWAVLDSEGVFCGALNNKDMEDAGFFKDITVYTTGHFEKVGRHVVLYIDKSPEIAKWETNTIKATASGESCVFLIPDISIGDTFEIENPLLTYGERQEGSKAKPKILLGNEESAYFELGATASAYKKLAGPLDSGNRLEKASFTINKVEDNGDCKKLSCKLLLLFEKPVPKIEKKKPQRNTQVQRKHKALVAGAAEYEHEQ